MDTELLNDDAILGGDYSEETPTVTTEEAQILGETQAAPEQPQAQTQQTQPVTDDVPNWSGQAEAGRAFAEMRARHAAELELARRQSVEEFLRSQQAAQQQQEAFDPLTASPEEFNRFIAEREARLAQGMQSQLTQIQAQHSVELARTRIEMQADKLGFGWDGALEKAWAEAQAIAPHLGVDPQQYVQAILKAPDAGDRIERLARDNAARSAQSQPVDMAKIQQEAYEKALKDIEARQAKSPHNLAPPGVHSLPAVSVRETLAKSEDEILAGD